MKQPNSCITQNPGWSLSELGEGSGNTLQRQRWRAEGRGPEEEEENWGRGHAGYHSSVVHMGHTGKRASCVPETGKGPTASIRGHSAEEGG